MENESNLKQKRALSVLYSIVGKGHKIKVKKPMDTTVPPKQLIFKVKMWIIL